jgi:hypothetical protein
MNTNTNIFEFASRHKFRYPYKGVITTEDLWDLTPAQLDIVYKALNANVKVAQEDSLMKNMSDADAALLIQIEIVKHIFAVKEQEAESHKKAAENTAKKQRIMEIIAKKQDDALENMSEADLLKMLNEL